MNEAWGSQLGIPIVMATSGLVRPEADGLFVLAAQEQEARLHCPLTTDLSAGSGMREIAGG